MKTFADHVQQGILTTLRNPPICHHCSRTMAEQFVIREATHIEADDSTYCDCQLGYPGHECDCTAVATAAQLLQGLKPTLHAEQCIACQ